MKKISPQQIEAIIQVMQKYNVGVQEYSAILKIFQEAPVEKEETPKSEKEA